MSSDKGSPPLPDHPLVSALWPLGPDAPPDERVKATLHAYAQSTGTPIPDPLTPEFKAAVSAWLVEQEEAQPTYNELGHSAALLHVKSGVTRPLIHGQAADKVRWLQQARCLTCLPDEKSPASPVFFGVRTRPFSAQSLGPELQELKSRISQSMDGRLKFSGDWTNASMCVTVIAVVAAADRTKDVDNMVKGLLDSLQGHLYVNDNQIAHLSVHRLTHDGDEGFYSLSARPVMDPLDDVINPELRLHWPGRPVISLDDEEATE